MEIILFYFRSRNHYSIHIVDCSMHDMIVLFGMHLFGLDHISYIIIDLNSYVAWTGNTQYLNKQYKFHNKNTHLIVCCNMLI